MTTTHIQTEHELLEQDELITTTPPVRTGSMVLGLSAHGLLSAGAPPQPGACHGGFKRLRLAGHPGLRNI